MTLPRHRALALLSECTGDDIWSAQHCQERGVPQLWIDELADAFESNPQQHSQTIFVGSETTNQYHGIRDVDLAIRIGESLGLDMDRVISMAFGRRGVVRAIKEAVMDGD